MGWLTGLIEKYNSALSKVVWGPAMLLLLLAVGVYLTIRTGVFQVRYTKKIFQYTIGGIKKEKTKNGISPFQATATALAGTMGTGNIVGVATAMTAGGAGAIFWMWVSAFFGMITKYAEILLAVHFRQKNSKGEQVGGPMYYLEKGLHQKWLAVLFAIFCALAAFGIGNMTQINSIAQTLDSTFGISPFVSGVTVAVLVGFVVLGGVKRIANVTSAVIPVLAVFYILGSILAIGLQLDKIPTAFYTIISDAFQTESAVGGVIGYACSRAVQFGFARGIFSNEAGLGSAPIAHAASNTDNAVKQGMWGVFEVFVDTIVMCTITALVILTSGLYGSGLDGAELTSAAYQVMLGDFTGIFMAISVSFFAFATLVGWCYYGERSVEYLWKQDSAIYIYRVIYVLLIVVGALLELKLVWSISDTLNGLMILPNLIGLIGLSPIVIRETRQFCKSEKNK